MFLFVIDQCFDDICIDEMLKCDKEIDGRDNPDKSAQYTGCGGQHICSLMLNSSSWNQPRVVINEG